MGAISSTGMMMRIIPRTVYDFTKVQASQTVQFIIAQHIDVGPFQEADFMIRCYNPSISPAGASITIQLLADGYTLDEPSLDFFSVNDGKSSAFGSIVYGNTTTTTTYSVLSVNNQFGRMLAVRLIATQPASTGSLVATISIDLALKGGDPAGLHPSYNTYRGYRS